MRVHLLRCLVLTASLVTSLGLSAEAQDESASAEAAPEAAAEPTPTETIRLKNGSTLVGKIVRMTDGVLIFEIESSAKELEIAFEDVIAIESNVSRRFMLKDGGASVGASDGTSANSIQVKSDTTGNVDIMLEDVVAIDPPEKRDTRHRGNIALSSRIEDGTDKSKTVSLLWDYEVRFTKRRLTLRGDWNYEEEEGAVTDRDAMAFAKYDYFFNAKTFFYGTSEVEGDDFDDLNLRTSVGVGIGRQLYEDQHCDLFIETGISFVNEDFIVTPDDRRLASRFAAEFDWIIIPGDLTYFANGESFWGYEDHEDIDFSVQTGIRANLVGSLFATAQMNFDYDNIPPAGDQRKEFEYLLGLGCSFDY